MTASQRLTLPTPLWRTFIALLATTVAFSGLLVTFNVAPARAADPTPAIVSLTFDDGYFDQLEAAKYLQSKGMLGTFYVNSGELGKDSHLNSGEVLDIQGMGHEIGGHTKTHPEWADLTTTADPQDEICGDRTALQALTGKAVTSFAWPFAYYTADLKLVAQSCGYTSARGLGDVKTPLGCDAAAGWCATALGETMPPGDRWFTAAPNQVERGWTQQNLQQSVQWTEGSTGSDKWLQLTFHHICKDMADCPDDEDHNPAFALSKFKTFIDWLAGESAAGRVRVKTVGDVVAGNITGAPSAPTDVTAKFGDRSADISWKKPVDDGGSTISGYTATSMPAGKTCTWTTGDLSCKVTGLTNGTAYTFAVTATNGKGTGAASDASPEVTPATVPGVPTTVKAVAGDGSAELSWKAPDSDGGSPITGYSITSSSGQTWTTDGRSYTATGLVNGTEYTFMVKAKNVVDYGPGASAKVTPATLPGAPTTVKAVAGDGSAQISWKAPDSDGGSKITKYTVTSSPGGKTCTTTGALSCTVKGLTNGATYVFQVVATNATGNGSASKASDAIGPASVPGAPTSAKAVAGNASAAVSWKAPVNGGGSRITKYTVTSSPGGKTCTTTGALSCTVKGLSNGTAYSFKVTATNAKGTGSASAASAPVKPTSGLRVTVSKAGLGNVLAVNVDPDMRAGSYVFRVERRAANGKWAAVGNYRTVAPTQTKSVTLGAGVFRVVVPAAGANSEAISGAVRLTAPMVQVKLRANGSKSKLVVDVDPNKGSGYWTFKVQKRRANGSWATLSTTYKTSGKAETRTVNQGKGTYRVVVAGKYGYQGAASTMAALSR